MAGTISLVTKPCSAVSSSTMSKLVAMASGVSTRTVAHRNTSAQPEHPVAVRRLVIGEPPQAAQHGGAAGVMGFAEPAYQGAVDGQAVVAGVLVGEDREFLEQM